MGVIRKMRRESSPRVVVRRRAGQMTVEVAVALPVLIVVALIAVNALTFFGYCAEFDRVSHDAVRVYAASPAYGQGTEQDCALIRDTVQGQFADANVSVSVSHGMTGADFDEYTATLEYAPTLFGRGMRAEVFGVSLPLLTHQTRYVIDRYRPGVIL